MASTDESPSVNVPIVSIIGEHRFVAYHPRESLSLRSPRKASYVTIISVPKVVSEAWLANILKAYRADDVFHDQFLRGLVLVSTTPSIIITDEAHSLLRIYGNEWIEIWNSYSTERLPAEGPYWTNRTQLFQIFRLYDDAQGAFVSGIVPKDEIVYQEIRLGAAYPGKLAIAVPSRFHSTEIDRKPLAGWRIGVKDIFEINGIHTSLCNWAYWSSHPSATATAGCIRRLLEAGASIVGTTKLASFAATEEPLECIDFQAPWNPRADGHQSPAGSSSGSGVAIASYPWLDIAIGSDTSGSGRRPGHWNGCFAMRSSHGVLPVDGYIPSFRRFDVPTFFGRDLEICGQFAEHWYCHELPHSPPLPPAIIYPTDYMALIHNKEQLRLIDGFVTDLEQSLGVKHEEVSFNEVWGRAPPLEAHGQSLQDYMRDACRDSFFYDDYHSFDQFRNDYWDRYAKLPYISPPVRRQWELSSTISLQARNEAIDRLELYREWFSKTILRPDTHRTLIIIPIENMSPRYRDEAVSNFVPVGVPMLFLSPILKAPELTIPIGETEYNSKVSGRIEKLPVGISVMAPPGLDRELFTCALKCLKDSGRPSCVHNGKNMFE